MSTKNQESSNNKMDEKPADFPFPSCWNNMASMKVMFADFNTRELNPGSFDYKIKFWEELIEQYCIHYGKATFCKQELLLKFAQGDRIPACLDSVLQQMQRTKKLQLCTEFEYDLRILWSGWAKYGFLWRSLSWGWEKVRNKFFSEDTFKQNRIEWVHLKVLKTFCKEVENNVLSEYCGKLLNYDAFKTLSTNCLNICDQTLFFIVCSLHCQHKIGLDYKLTDKKQLSIDYIKIPTTKDNSIIITDSDRALHSLLMTQSNLLEQIKELECDINSNEEKARQLILVNKRQLAKTYLRRKKLMEAIYEKRSVALHNVDLLLAYVSEAQQNGGVVEAYKIGSKALQNALNDSGLKYDNIDEVMVDVRDTIEQARELQETISNTNLVDLMEHSSDDDIEQELKKLVSEADKAVTIIASHQPKETITNNNEFQRVIAEQELSNMLNVLNVEDGTLSNNNVTTQLSVITK